MRVPKNPIYIITFLFSLGMLLCASFSISITLLWKVFVLYLLVTIFCLFIISKRFHALKCLILYCSFMLLGALNYKNFYSPNKNHFEHHLPKEQLITLQLEIIQYNGANSFSHSYKAKVEAFKNNSLNGKVLVYQKKDSLTPPFKKGTFLFAQGILKEIAPPKNPGTFNYKKFLSQQSINYQFSLQEAIPLNAKKGPIKSLQNAFLKGKVFVLNKIQKSGLKTQSKQMIQTLMLGDRNAIDESIREAYANAGVIHLLAISGLHLGILAFFFSLLLSPLKKVLMGNNLRGVLVLVLLWSFAFFSGASPSAVRAATMFSFLVFAQMANRSGNSIHFLTLSFLLLLIIHPPYLHKIGFQMSYAAVFGILWIYPLLHKFFIPKYYLPKIFVQAFYISLAAQLIVTPLSIFYFNQFPGLFFISNLVIVPFFSLFLILTLCTLLFSLFFKLPPFWQWLYDKIIELLNGFINLIANQDQFLLKELTIDQFELSITYIVLLSLLLFFKSVKANYLLLFFIGILSLNLYDVYEEIKVQKENSLWILHQNNAEIIAIQKGEKVFVVRDLENKKSTTILNDFKIALHIKEVAPMLPLNFYSLGKIKLLRIGEEAETIVFPHTPTHLLLSKNSRINLERWLSLYRFELVIADGSNASWNVERWEKTCKQLNVPFHNTLKKRALKITL